MAAFILEITTTSASETVVIPGTGTGYSYDIDWDDGSPDLGQTSNSPSHVYASVGTYQVAISGTFPRVYYNNGAYKNQLTGIVQWGDENTWSTNQSYAFYGCSNLTGSIPGDTSGPFASLINGGFMFQDTSVSGTLPSGMTLANLDNGDSMFRNTAISGALPSGMTLANVTNGINMFDATSISGALPSVMTLASLTICTNMFRNTSISGALPSGMALASLTNGTNMFVGTLIDAVFYSPLLKAMEANNSNNNVKFNSGGAKYWSGDAATARAALVGRSWTIIDGGEDTGVDWTNDDYIITGDFAVNNDTIWPKGTGTITLSGGNADIDFNGESIEDVEIDSTGTKTLTGTATMGDLTLTQGTLDINGNNVTCDNITMAANTSIVD